MKIELITYSYNHRLSHIPSALSMLTYIDVLFTLEYVKPTDYIILGKPFGSQAYYLVWKKLGYLDKIDQLSVGVKHDEIEFVKYSEETIGNALGVASGIAMTTNKQIWVNLSDAALQMGNTLEAIQFIGQHNLKNVFVTIDYNNAQCTGNVNNIIATDPCKNFFKEYNWNVQEIDGHNRTAIEHAYKNLSSTLPNVVFCNTIKGHGFPSIERDIQKWHYKKIETLTELQLLVQELRDT